MTRFCPTCGTEIDESALFCPSCGQPIAPVAEPAPEAARSQAAPTPPDASSARTEAHPGSAQPEAAGQPPLAAPPPRSSPPPGAAPQPEGAGRGQPNVPITWPVMLSGWLIGGGATAAALGAVIGLFGGFVNAIDLVLLVALLLIAATVFFSASIPAIPHLRLITLVVVLIGFGMALDRIGFGRAGVGTLLVFLGTAAASIGAIVLELGRDQPVGGFGA